MQCVRFALCLKECPCWLLCLRSIITHRLPLSDGVRAYKWVRDGMCAKSACAQVATRRRCIDPTVSRICWWTRASLLMR